MKKAMKWIMAILALIVIVIIASPNASASEIVASGSCGKNVTWTLDDEGLLTISGTGAMHYYSSSTTYISPYSSDNSLAN